jgi:ferredoxin
MLRWSRPRPSFHYLETIFTTSRPSFYYLETMILLPWSGLSFDLPGTPSRLVACGVCVRVCPLDSVVCFCVCIKLLLSLSMMRRQGQGRRRIALVGGPGQRGLIRIGCRRIRVWCRRGDL